MSDVQGIAAPPEPRTPATGPAVGRDVFVGRQAIYTRDGELDSYELLFRTGQVNAANVVDGDEATFTVMLNALAEIGLEQLVGRHRAYINVTRNSVLCSYPQFFPKEQVVLEVLEDVIPDAEFVATVRGFVDQGYILALDDFEDREELKPLLEVASIIKMDVLALGTERLSEQARRFSKYRLLAEKVETVEQFEFCKSLGFELFQGYLFAKPKIVTVRHVPTSQIQVLHVLQRIFDPEITTAQAAEVIGRDPALTYRLLRTVSPGDTRPGVQVSSVKEAVEMIGIGRLTHWITLLSISGVDDASLEDMFRATVRARTAEILASQDGRVKPEAAYLVGLLSNLGSAMGCPETTLLESLCVTDEVAVALTTQAGPLGAYLCRALAVERDDFEGLSLPARDLGILREAHLAAVAWAEAARAEIGY